MDGRNVRAAVLLNTITNFDTNRGAGQYSIRAGLEQLDRILHSNRGRIVCTGEFVPGTERVRVTTGRKFGTTEPIYTVYLTTTNFCEVPTAYFYREVNSGVGAGPDVIHGQDARIDLLAQARSAIQQPTQE